MVYAPLVAHPYNMAMSPYPGEDSNFENPSFLWSDDGDTWAVPGGLVNPIVAKPAAAYNADCGLLYDQAGTWWIYYKESDNAATYDRIYCVSSADRVTWGAPALLLDLAFRGGLSPVVLWDGTQYVMYTVNAENLNAVHIERRTCATPNGVWSAAADVTLNKVVIDDIWHIGVTYADGRFYMVVYTVTGDLYFAIGNAAGTSFDMSYHPLLHKGGSNWTTKSLYKASLVRITGGFDMWYSGIQAGAPTVVHIGRTRITL